MTTIAKKGRRRSLLLSLPFLLILSVCRVDTDITVGEDGGTASSVTFGTEDLPTKIGDCQVLSSQMEFLKSAYSILIIESVPDVGNMGCKLTFKDGPFLKTLAEKDDEGHVTVIVPRTFWQAVNGQLEDPARSKMGDLKFKMGITLPSEATDVNKDGRINGNTVEWDDHDIVKRGVSATAGGELGYTSIMDDESESLSESPAAAKSTSPEMIPDDTLTPWASPKKDKDTPMWTWLAVSGGVLVTVIVTILLVTHRESDGDFPGSGGCPGPGGGFPGPGGGYPGPSGYPDPGGGSYPGTGSYPGFGGEYPGPGGGYSGPGDYPGPDDGDCPDTGSYPSPGGPIGLGGRQPHQGQYSGGAFPGSQSVQPADQVGAGNALQALAGAGRVSSTTTNPVLSGEGASAMASPSAQTTPLSNTPGTETTPLPSTPSAETAPLSYSPSDFLSPGARDRFTVSLSIPPTKVL